MRNLLDRWRRIWFTPASPGPVCMYRIFFGATAFAMGLSWQHDLRMWFGEHGIVSQETVKGFVPELRLSLFSWFHVSDSILAGMLAVYMLSAACLSMGLGTRISAVIVYFLMASFEDRNPFILTSGDRFMRTVAFLMIFSPAGKMFSVDSLLRRGTAENQYCSPWIQRLIQLQMAALYWHAFWNKVFIPSWQNGTAAYYSITYMGQCPFLLQFLLHHTYMSRILSWGTLVIEFLLWSLIWVKACRYWILLMGLLLHISIGLLMDFRLFQVAMVCCYINFVDPKHVELAVANCGKRLQPVTAWILKIWNRCMHLA